ncbi:MULTISPECIES: 2-amino-4-hydroxy-6-hydroxymethyldihydropteridine diphosphokinase [Sphingomonas]|uniref:2-amino-4-hydroxy-6- hydroxymethyldihydropteridine diphosphokinase n=1 Tax=Sphingomonas TaxID=13687 RepID=UPI0015EB368A|nr:2-amino-4-hydroxy-6-hydroxymethyldihydropteridine diphosphokinase [Sphingomonas sp. CGMCC 1.13658]MBA2919612.1 2-amino-4-hydroxy-6-hydroxymethyldihydropteridine diphosphokinase [Sphingomonas sp. CGMCC 1.13658]
MPVSSYAIAIGSNRPHHRHGDPAGVVRAAMHALAELGTVQARSRILRTAPLGPAGRSFANAVAILETDLPPPAVLASLKQLERQFGRRRGRRWGARVLDLDIILWSGGVWAENGLTIPHPEFRKRRFVLAPLEQIAPGARDPLTGRTVRQLRHAVDRRFPRA